MHYIAREATTTLSINGSLLSTLGRFGESSMRTNHTVMETNLDLERPLKETSLRILKGVTNGHSLLAIVTRHLAFERMAIRNGQVVTLTTN